jgi:hypothetical protein
MLPYDMERWRTELQNLSWSQGFTKEELMQRFPNIPRTYFQSVPSGRKFYSFNEFWTEFMPTTGSGGTRETGGPGTAGR